MSVKRISKTECSIRELTKRTSQELRKKCLEVIRVRFVTIAASL